MEMTIESLLQMGANKYSRQEAVLFEDARVTFSQLNDAVNQRANALLGLGVKKGDHVATLSLNCLELVECLFAIWRIGAIIVPLNIRLSPSELTYVINHADVSSVIFLDRYEETIRKIQPEIREVKNFFLIGESCPPDFIDLEAKKKEQSALKPFVEVREKDVASILYTAGTTGKPKGVVATHLNWVWSIINILGSLRMPSNVKSLTAYPLFHVASLINLLSDLAKGSTIFLMKEFTPRKVLEVIEKEKINRLGNPPTVYNMLLQVPEIGSFDLGSVKYLGSGAEVMPEETRNRLKDFFPEAGIFDNYGMTETCGFQCSRSAEYTDSKPYSVGIPPVFMELRVVNERGEDVAPGEVGEIIVRGPNVMKEYYRDPEKTAEALRGDWLYTKDMGRLDEERFLYIVERKHNMIITGGENVYPKEIENVLYQHPKIVEAAVLGMPDKVWGERVCAAVVLKKGEEMTTEEVVNFCKQNLATFKKPKSVAFVQALPRNPVGKVLRAELKKYFNPE